MNATKRKFNALLSSIGSRPLYTSTGEDSELQKELTLPLHKDLAKKRRVTERFSNFSQKKNVPLDSRSSLSHKISLDCNKTSTTSVEPTIPMYAPWDREEFLKRLKSFSNISHWTPKPAPVNEVEWAKRGWICQKFERVRCYSCNVEIVVKLNKKNINGKEEPVYVAHAIEEALVEKYIRLIVTSHEKTCLWRKRGCDDSIFRLPLNQSSTTIKNLQKRYEEIKSCRENLPYMHNIRTPEEFDLESTLRYLPKYFFATENSTTKVSLTSEEKVAFIMAIYGWQGYQHERLGMQPNSVSCNVCFRVLGLWMFKSKEINENGEKILGATMNCLDVVGQHREYCPWRNPKSQNGPSSTTSSPSKMLPGWKVVLRVLKNESSLLSQSSSLYKRPSHDIERTNGREEKDKEMRSRLNRVRSLFVHHNTKKNLNNGASKSVSHINIT